MATEAGFGVVKAHRAMDFVRSPPHKCWAIIGSGSASANGSSRDVDLTGELHGPVFEPLADPGARRQCQWREAYVAQTPWSYALPVYLWRSANEYDQVWPRETRRAA